MQAGDGGSQSRSVAGHRRWESLLISLKRGELEFEAETGNKGLNSNSGKCSTEGKQKHEYRALRKEFD